MGEIINKICGHLPEGWEIQLCMENGAAWVRVFEQKGGGEDICIEGGGQSLEEQLNEALCIANGFSK